MPDHLMHTTFAAMIAWRADKINHSSAHDGDTTSQIRKTEKRENSENSTLEYARNKKAQKHRANRVDARNGKRRHYTGM